MAIALKYTFKVNSSLKGSYKKVKIGKRPVHNFLGTLSWQGMGCIQFNVKLLKSLINIISKNSRIWTSKNEYYHVLTKIYYETHFIVSEKLVLQG